MQEVPARHALHYDAPPTGEGRPMPKSDAAALAVLERLRAQFGANAAAAKRQALDALADARFARARDVRRLHDALCRMRACPDDADVLARVERLLGGFAARADLRAHADALADSGIAGTVTRYRFFHGQAAWLAARWPAQLKLDRTHAEVEPRLARALPVLLTPLEAHALRESQAPGFAALDRVRDARLTDATFLLRRIAAMPGDAFTHERFADELDATYALQPGADTPSRSAAKDAAARVVFQRTPLPRERPDLRAEIAQPPRGFVRVSGARAAALIDLARGAMVLRQRALHAFSHGDPRDVWLAEDGALAIAFAGVLPERRHPVAAAWSFMLLRNGVPVGYGQADCVGASAALSFNIFETFRGGDNALHFARLLAALSHGFGATSFTLDPYQIGHDNDEAIASGAWWFYAKLGFAPRAPAALARAAKEARRLRRDAGQRTSEATLRGLAAHPLFLDTGAPLPLPPLVELGLRAAQLLSTRGGADREATLDALVRETGGAELRGASARAWRDFAPVAALFGLERWSAAERAALLDVVRAKAGRSERDYLARYLAHPRLHGALHAAAG
jgi:hypothetical protein